jgi:hypothetical protein
MATTLATDEMARTIIEAALTRGPVGGSIAETCDDNPWNP